MQLNKEDRYILEVLALFSRYLIFMLSFTFLGLLYSLYSVRRDSDKLASATTEITNKLYQVTTTLYIPDSRHAYLEEFIRTEDYIAKILELIKVSPDIDKLKIANELKTNLTSVVEKSGLIFHLSLITENPKIGIDIFNRTIDLLQSSYQKNYPSYYWFLIVKSPTAKEHLPVVQLAPTKSEVITKLVLKTGLFFFLSIMLSLLFDSFIKIKRHIKKLKLDDIASRNLK